MFKRVHILITTNVSQEACNVSKNPKVVANTLNMLLKRSGKVTEEFDNTLSSIL